MKESFDLDGTLTRFKIPVTEELHKSVHKDQNSMTEFFTAERMLTEIPRLEMIEYFFSAASQNGGSIDIISGRPSFCIEWTKQWFENLKASMSQLVDMSSEIYFHLQDYAKYPGHDGITKFKVDKLQELKIERHYDDNILQLCAIREELPDIELVVVFDIDNLTTGISMLEDVQAKRTDRVTIVSL